MFEEAVDRLLGVEVTPALIRAAEGGAWPATLWMLIEEAGLPLAAVPEALGGVGAAWCDCFAICTAAGRHAVPLPLVETMAVNALLGQGDFAPVDGPASLGSTSNDAAGITFSGVVTDVPWGRNVAHILAGTPQHLVLLATEHSDIATAANVAGEPRDRLTFQDAPILRAVALPGAASLLRATVASLRAAQMAGALARLRGLCVRYANDREQFGRLIAKFQAVQHQIAVLAENAAIARAAAEGAFQLAVIGEPFAQAVAKQVASEAAGEGAAIAHAVFGAIGFTQEHDLHLLTRRLWSWRAECGNARFWAEAIGNSVGAAGSAAFWPNLTSGGGAIELRF